MLDALMPKVEQVWSLVSHFGENAVSERHQRRVVVAVLLLAGGENAGELLHDVVREGRRGLHFAKLIDIRGEGDDPEPAQNGVVQFERGSVQWVVGGEDDKLLGHLRQRLAVQGPKG